MEEGLLYAFGIFGIMFMYMFMIMTTWCYTELGLPQEEGSPLQAPRCICLHACGPTIRPRQGQSLNHHNGAECIIVIICIIM